MYGVEWLIGLGVLGLLAGLGGGYLLARRAWGGSARLKELEAEAQASRQELDDYRQEVVNQFSETARKFQALNDSYTDLHQHLAHSSSILCGDASGPLLAAPAGHQDLLPGSARSEEGREEPSAGSGKEPSAGSGKEPSAGSDEDSDEEPSAFSHKEPSAGANKQPSAGANKQPSARSDTEPSTSNKEPSAAAGQVPPSSPEASPAPAGNTAGKPDGPHSNASARQDNAAGAGASPSNAAAPGTATATAPRTPDSSTPETRKGTLSERLDASAARAAPAATSAESARSAEEDEEPPVLRDVQAPAPAPAERAGNDILVPEPGTTPASETRAKASGASAERAGGQQSGREAAEKETGAGTGEKQGRGADHPGKPADRQAHGGRG